MNQKVKIYFSLTKTIIEVPVGTTLKSLTNNSKVAPEKDLKTKGPIVAFKVNNSLTSLSEILDEKYASCCPSLLKSSQENQEKQSFMNSQNKMDKSKEKDDDNDYDYDKDAIKLEPIFFLSNIGHQLYRRTCIFILSKVSSILFPSSLFTCEHQLANGYLCRISDGVTKEKIEKLIQKMKEFQNRGLNITVQKKTLKNALYYFSKVLKQPKPYTLSLLKANNDPFVKLDCCDGYYSIHHRVLLSNTKYLTGFKIEQLPNSPKSIWVKFPENVAFKNYNYNQHELISVYNEHNKWGEFFKINCVGDLNQMIRNYKIKEFMSLCHHLQDNKIQKIAQKIIDKKTVRLILISGPSSSGKTTFSKKLSLSLQIHNIIPKLLSVDDYYKPVSELPLLPNGEKDYENPQGLRLELLNQHLNDIFQGKTIDCPKYDFKTGKPFQETHKFSLKENEILVMEGLHCLNDVLTSKVDNKFKFKIFMAPLTQLNLDEINYISNSTNRLLRRIVRDYRTRNASVIKTLNFWPKVRLGEHKNIFPYLSNADVVFNSALDYEICVLKVHVKHLLKAVKPTSKHFNSILELLLFLRSFHSIQNHDVPLDSLLREFIGGSFFQE